MTKILAIKPSAKGEHKISFTQLKTLAHLSTREGGYKFGEIKSFLGRAKSQVSMLLSTLQDKGLISRTGHKPQLNVITEQGMEFLKKELKDFLPSISAVYLNNKSTEKECKTSIWRDNFILSERINEFLSQFNSSLIYQLTHEFERYLKADLSEKLTQLIVKKSNPQQEIIQTDLREEWNNSERTELFERLIIQIKKIIKHELKDSLERLPDEIIQDIQRNISNRIHDKLYEIF